MAVYRSLRAIARDQKNYRTFLTLSSLPASTSPSPSSSSASYLLSHYPFLSRPRVVLSKWIPSSHGGGPLFLSSPPWKLSQSATPLYLQSDIVLFPKVQALKKRLRSVSSVSGLLRGTRTQESTPPEKVDDDVVTPGAGGGFAGSFVNLPNLISMSRLNSGPVLGWMIIHEMYLPAFIGLAISGATDWLDGYVARKMGINSVVGSYLDPLADKVLVGCVALAMVDKDLLNSGLVGLIVLRDVGLVAGAVYKRASSLDWEWKSWSDFFNLDGTRPQRVEPLFLSKVNTVFQLVLVTAALLQPEFGTPETQSYITYLSWLVASTTVASTAAYGAQHLRSRSLSVGKNL